MNNKKEKFNVEKFLKESNAIFNYIYDNRGFKVGIVLAMKTPLKGKCKIGWALFEENRDINCKVLSKLRDIPALMKRINDIKDHIFTLSFAEESQGIKENRKEFVSLMQEVKSLEDIDLNSSDVYYYLENASDMKDIFISAKERANHDSWNYYCAKGTDLSETDLRTDVIKIKTPYEDEYEETHYYYTSSDTELCKAIRKAVRKMEHRAWRYFR